LKQHINGLIETAEVWQRIADARLGHNLVWEKKVADLEAKVRELQIDNQTSRDLLELISKTEDGKKALRKIVVEGKLRQAANIVAKDKLNDACYEILKDETPPVPERSEPSPNDPNKFGQLPEASQEPKKEEGK